MIMCTNAKEQVQGGGGKSNEKAERKESKWKNELKRKKKNQNVKIEASDFLILSRKGSKMHNWITIGEK